MFVDVFIDVFCDVVGWCIFVWVDQFRFKMWVGIVVQFFVVFMDGKFMQQCSDGFVVFFVYEVKQVLVYGVVMVWFSNVDVILVQFGFVYCFMEGGEYMYQIIVVLLDCGIGLFWVWFVVIECCVKV